MDWYQQGLQVGYLGGAMSDPLLEGQKYWLWKTRRLYDSLAIAVPSDRRAKAGTNLRFRVEDVTIAGLTIVKFVHLSALRIQL